ncbi:YbaB/EbfC family nucleoid-associated protein [Candidatus Haliotispira prima]|uniref:Nucleoid-associated protein P0082_01645 n=1 Tax=Candidatus Haliotispira prima TaxID=3034016 RepID=A0ABY8MHT6_9SPIO|nr:YbaB/EbfC family nucleoid-associated protein [Candidatus Haliotispira prima]
MNPLELLQQANLKSNINELQNQLQTLSATGSAGGELVLVTFNGAMEVQSVKIDPLAVDPRDVEMLEQLVASAVTDAQNKIKQKIQSQFNPMMGMFGSGS